MRLDPSTARDTGVTDLPSNLFLLHRLLFLLPRGRSRLDPSFVQAWIIKTRRRWRRWMNYNRVGPRKIQDVYERASGDFACTIPRAQIDLSLPISITGIYDNCTRASRSNFDDRIPHSWGRKSWWANHRVGDVSIPSITIFKLI